MFSFFRRRPKTSPDELSAQGEIQPKDTRPPQSQARGEAMAYVVNNLSLTPTYIPNVLAPSDITSAMWTTLPLAVVINETEDPSGKWQYGALINPELSVTIMAQFLPLTSPDFHREQRLFFDDLYQAAFSDFESKMSRTAYSPSQLCEALGKDVPDVAS